MGKLVTKLQSPGDIFEWDFALPHQFLIDLLIYSWIILARLRSIPEPGAQSSCMALTHHRGRLWLGGVWSMADNTNDGYVDVSRSAARWKIDKSQWLGVIMVNVVVMLAPASSSVELQPRRHSALCWRISVIVLGEEQCPTDWGGHRVQRTFWEDGSDPHPASGQLLWFR